MIRFGIGVPSRSTGQTTSKRRKPGSSERVRSAWSRIATMNELFGEKERQSRLTSRYTLVEPLRWHIEKLVRERDE